MKEAAKSVSLHDVSSAGWGAEKSGFSVGHLYSKKGSGDIFKLHDMGETEVTFVMQSLFHDGDAVTEAVSFDELLKTFIPYKGKLQTKVSKEAVGKHDVLNHMSIGKDVERASIFEKLIQLGKEHATCEQSLDFYLSPAEVRASKHISPKALKLVPAADMGKITAYVAKAGSASGAIVTGGSVPFSLEQPLKPKHEKPTEWPKGVLTAAYWWVHATTDEAAANIVSVNAKIGNIQIPMFTNTRALNKFDKLCYFAGGADKKKKA